MKVLFSTSIFFSFNSEKVVSWCLKELLEKTSLTDEDLGVLYLNPGSFQAILEGARKGAIALSAGVSAFAYNERWWIMSATDRELVAVDKKEDQAIAVMEKDIGEAPDEKSVEFAKFKFEKKHEVYQKNREDIISLDIKKKEGTLVGKAMKWAETGGNMFDPGKK